MSNLAVIYNTINQHQKAIDLFQILLRSDPDSPSLHLNLGMAYLDSGCLQVAKEEFFRVIELEPENTERHSKAKFELEEMENKSRSC